MCIRDRLQWAGHIVRMNNGQILKEPLQETWTAEDEIVGQEKVGKMSLQMQERFWESQDRQRRLEPRVGGGEGGGFNNTVYTKGLFNLPVILTVTFVTFLKTICTVAYKYLHIILLPILKVCFSYLSLFSCTLPLTQHKHLLFFLCL